MAYWRRSLGQMQAANDSVAVAPAVREAAKDTVKDTAKAAKSPRSRMMRQYDLVERVRSYNPDTNEDLLNRAYVYAMKAHGTQTRASGDPYFSHPLEVAAILTGLKLDDATIVAALLHDTIEDTEATRAEIDNVFGHEIGALVEGLTKLKRLELVSREAKQAENLRKLLLAIADDVRVLLIKLADRLHNMRTLEFVPHASRRRIAEETLDIYAPLAGRMGMQEMREELEDLSFFVLDPEAYAVVKQRLDGLADRNRNLIGEIETQLSKNLQKNGITARVVGRRKQPFSIWTKMERKSVGFEQLSDIYGFRIILDDVGIDQLSLFNPQIPQPVTTSNLNTLVSHGAAFNNAWMMPECSPSRACFFTGRYPLRTGVTAAILDYDLPSAQVSPYEATLPKVLANAGYSSALIGKYHLGGPTNNPAGFRSPASLGWDYFNGNLHGGPPFIDTTLGGQR